jgi:hypothetical protein
MRAISFRAISSEPGRSPAANFTGASGNDRFLLGGAFTANDHIDGGDGHDRVVLDGDYSAGLAGYQPGDFVIEVTGFTGTLSTDDFIT